MGCLEIGKGSLYLWGGLRCCVKTGLARHSRSDSAVSPPSCSDQRQPEVREWRQEACQSSPRPGLDALAGGVANHTDRRREAASDSPSAWQQQTASRRRCHHVRAVGKRLVPLCFWESSNEMKLCGGFCLIQMEMWELKAGVPTRYWSLRLRAAAPRASRHLMHDVSRRRRAPARGLRHAATSANPRQHSEGSHSSNLSVLTSFRDKMSDLPEEGTPPHTHSAPPPAASAATPCESNYCNWAGLEAGVRWSLSSAPP